MKPMANVNSKKFGLKFGYIVLMVLFLGIFSFPAWGAPEDYEGTYSGTYAGDDNGIFIAYVDNTGDIQFITWSNDYATVDGGEGTVGTNGGIDLFTDDLTHVTGNIGLVSGVSGSWVNGADNGTFSGTEQDPTQVDDYAGNYSGEFCGDDDGTWDITVQTTGYISGTVHTSGGDIFVEGGVNAAGDFIVFAYGENAAVRGTISSGNVTGYWRSEDDGSSGYISNTGTCGPITSALGDSGGGGGCFVSTLFN